MVSFEFCEISMSTFSDRTPPVAASVQHQVKPWKYRMTSSLKWDSHDSVDPGLGIILKGYVYALV